MTSLKLDTYRRSRAEIQNRAWALFHLFNTAGAKSLAARHDERRQPTRDRMQAVVERHIGYAQSETLRNIEHAGLAQTRRVYNASTGFGAAADLTFDLDSFSDGLTLAMRKEQKAALNTAAEQLVEELRAQGVKDLPDVFKMPPDAVIKFLDQRENLIKGASEQVHDEVMNTVQQGLDAGDTTDELADRVKGKFDDMTTARAKMIATTETGAAYGVARHDGLKQAGIQKKKWLTAEDDRVRAAHEDADGQVRDIDEPFDVGGEQLQYPCDEAGSPENVINCRCVSIAAMPDDDQAEPGASEEEEEDEDGN